MSTDTGKSNQREIELKEIAAVGDKILVRLLALAPVALLVLLALEPARESSGFVIIGMVVAALLWSVINVHRTV